MKHRKFTALLISIAMLLSALSIGTVSATALDLQDDIYGQLSDYPTESRHFILSSDLPLRGNISPANVSLWLEALDNLYDAYDELTSFHTCYGQKLTILLSSDTYGQAWVYGHPYAYIYLQESYAPDWFSDIQSYFSSGKVDLGFGFMHEIGHMYDADIWNFEPELLANFKMAYALEKYDYYGSIGYNWGPKYPYKGAEIKDYYELSYIASGNLTNEFSGDGFTYALLEIKNIVGWDAYKMAFNKLSEYREKYGDRSSATRSDRLNLFFTMLREFSGYDVINYFNSAQKKVIADEFGGELKYVNILGDTDENGVINIMDATIIQFSLVGSEDVNQALADTNMDSEVNIKDVTELQLYLVDILKNSDIGYPQYSNYIDIYFQDRTNTKWMRNNDAKFILHINDTNEDIELTDNGSLWHAKIYSTTSSAVVYRMKPDGSKVWNKWDLVTLSELGKEYNGIQLGDNNQAWWANF